MIDRSIFDAQRRRRLRAALTWRDCYRDRGCFLDAGRAVRIGPDRLRGRRAQTIFATDVAARAARAFTVFEPISNTGGARSGTVGRMKISCRVEQPASGRINFGKAITRADNGRRLAELHVLHTPQALACMSALRHLSLSLHGARYAIELIHSRCCCRCRCCCCFCCGGDGSINNDSAGRRYHRFLCSVVAVL